MKIILTVFHIFLACQYSHSRPAAENEPITGELIANGLTAEAFEDTSDSAFLYTKYDRIYCNFKR